MIMKIIILTLLAILQPLLTYGMLRVPHAHSNRIAMTAPAASAIRRNTAMAPRRSSVSMPNPVRQHHEINTQLRKAYAKKIAAQCKSIAWNASGIAIVLPTVATYYFSGAGIFASLLTWPNLSPEDCFDAQVPFLILGTVHLASRAALSAEEKLCDFIAKKCDENDKEVTETRNLIDELQKQHKALLDKSV